MSRSYRHGKHQKAKHYGGNWRWLRQEPKWWRRYYKHKPRRQAVRQCIHKVRSGDLDVTWPLDTKPWIYYW